MFATLFTRAIKSSFFSGEQWDFQKKKDDKITKNSKKIKEIDVENLRQKFGIMNKKKLVAAD